MNAVDLSFLALCLGMALMLIRLLCLRVLRTGLLRPAIVATARMTVQLMLIGVYLKYLFELDRAWVNVLWMAIMAIVASFSAVSRTPLRRSVLLLPVFVGFLSTALAVSLYFLAVVLQVEDVFAARLLIPVSGVLFGNMLTVNIMAVNVFYGDLRREHQLYYYLLAHGATRFEAVLPFLREAVVKALSPCLANMAVLGIVSFPGTMVGQILGGASPQVAIRYQLMISVITVVASMLSLIVTIGLSVRSSFDQYGVLKQVFK